MVSKASERFKDIELTEVEAASRRSVVHFLQSREAFPEKLPDNSVIDIFDNTELYWSWDVSEEMIAKLNTIIFTLSKSGLSPEDQTVVQALVKQILFHKRNKRYEDVAEQKLIERGTFCQRLKKWFRNYITEEKKAIMSLVNNKDQEIVDSYSRDWEQFIQDKKINHGAIAIVVLEKIGHPLPESLRHNIKPVETEEIINYLELFKVMFNALQTITEDTKDEIRVVRYRVESALEVKFENPQGVLFAMKEVADGLKPD